MGAQHECGKHAIFSNSGLNYFEGNVGLGTQTPSDRLHLVGGTGRFENSSTTGVAVLGQSLATTGSTVAGHFENFSTDGRAVVGEAHATTGITYGLWGLAASSTGRGVNGVATSSTGTNVGGRFTSFSNVGVGVHGYGFSNTGTPIGVLGEVNSPTGFSGYFTGPAGSRNYFQRAVGIGTEDPLAELHVANVSGNADLLIKRNDSTFGFNLGVSGTPTKLFMARTDGTTFTDILTLDGSTDRVGIGTTAPEARLDVRGFADEDALRVRVDGATKFRVYSNGGAAIGSNPTTVPQDGLCVHGNVGIGVLNPTFQLHLSTNSAAKPTSSTWTISSDARLKKNIRTIDHALNDLLALRGVTYQWIDPASQGNMAGTYTGLIAQEVEPIFPEWISEDAEGFKRLTVIGFEGIVVEALRELRAEKDAQLDQLRSEKDAEIADLRARVEQLEKLLLRAGAASE